MSITAGCVLKRDRGIKEVDSVFAYPIYNTSYRQLVRDSHEYSSY